MKSKLFATIGCSLFLSLTWFGIVLAQGGGTVSVNFENPLNTNDVLTLINTVLDYFLKAIGGMAVLSLVIGAVMYTISGGDEKKVTAAKSAITAAMIGLAIGIGAPTFLNEIITIMGWSGSVPGNPKTVAEIAQGVLEFLLSIIGILALIMMVIGGIMYFKAAGNEKDIEAGKKIFQTSIIGIAVALGSLVIVRQIANFFD